MCLVLLCIELVQIKKLLCVIEFDSRSVSRCWILFGILYKYNVLIFLLDVKFGFTNKGTFFP